MEDMKDLFSSGGEDGVVLGGFNMDGSIVCTNSTDTFMIRGQNCFAIRRTPFETVAENIKFEG